MTEFLARVEQACLDLPKTRRRELLAHLGEHLKEIDLSSAGLQAQLGAPEDYARELRAALELAPRQEEVGRRRHRRRWLWAALAVAVLGGTVAAAVATNNGGHQLGSSPRTSSPNAQPSRGPLPPGAAYLGNGFWTIRVDHTGGYRFATEKFAPAFPLKNFSTGVLLRQALRE